MAVRAGSGKSPGRPRKATSALIPAAARVTETLTPIEATLNEEAIEVFVRAVGGRDQLADVLSVVPVSSDVDKVANYLLDPRYQSMSLRRLCTLAGITVADLFASYRKALIAKAHIEASHIIASKLVPVVDDVMTRAAPQRMLCPKCLGTSAAGQGPCPLCQDSGVIQSEPDLDRQKLALELGQLTEKKGGLLIQQNTVAAAALASTGPGALEQLQQAVNDVLYTGRATAKESAP